MKQYHKNPRKLSAEQEEKLRQNIIELGDFSGTVHDLNTGEIISGNQRSKIIDLVNKPVPKEKIKHSSKALDLITFKQFIAYGLNVSTNIVDGFPWSFDFMGHAVTHETDDLYLINTKTATLRFSPDKAILTDGKRIALTGLKLYE